MDKIQQLIDRHDAFKKKWLQNNEESLFDWVMLWEEMLDHTTTLRSKYQEEKQQIDVEKWLRMIALKTELDDNGKKKHTESTADATINQEFQDKHQFLSSLKLQSELLQNKTGVINEYINIIKLYMKK